MTRRALAIASSLFLNALVAGGAASFSTGTTPPVDAGPTGTPVLRIARPLDGACVAVAPGPDPSIRVILSVADANGADTFVLRAPGGCVGLINCGHVAIQINGNESVA